MRYLLDTHVFLWWLNNDKKLKAPIKQILRDSKNTIFTSVVSAWEISIKLKTNPKFSLREPLEKCFHNTGFVVLPIKLEHVFVLDKLPSHHKDPFDRILVAQSKAENLSFITTDPKIWQYDVAVIKV